MERKIKNNTIFVIEASSYQLDYSKYYKSKYSIILNLSPDHLERHGSFKNYVEAKFKIVKSQSNNDITFIDNENKFLKELVKKNKIKSKIIKIDHFENKKYCKQIDNIYFNNSSNEKNLSFVFCIAKALKINLKTVINTANKFKGLDYRQQVIYKSKNLLDLIWVRELRKMKKILLTKWLSNSPINKLIRVNLFKNILSFYKPQFLMLNETKV